MTYEITGRMSTSYNSITGDACHGSQGQRHWRAFVPTLTDFAGIYILTFMSKMQTVVCVE